MMTARSKHGTPPTAPPLFLKGVARGSEGSEHPPYNPPVAAATHPPAWRGLGVCRPLKQKPETPEIRRLRREIRTAYFRGWTVADVAHLLHAMTRAVRRLERKHDDKKTQR